MPPPSRRVMMYAEVHGNNQGISKLYRPQDMGFNPKAGPLKFENETKLSCREKHSLRAVGSHCSPAETNLTTWLRHRTTLPAEPSRPEPAEHARPAALIPPSTCSNPSSQWSTATSVRAWLPSRLPLTRPSRRPRRTAWLSLGRTTPTPARGCWPTTRAGASSSRSASSLAIPLTRSLPSVLAGRLASLPVHPPFYLSTSFSP